MNDSNHLVAIKLDLNVAVSFFKLGLHLAPIFHYTR
jgi:hypothetical protein